MSEGAREKLGEVKDEEREESVEEKDLRKLCTEDHQWKEQNPPYQEEGNKEDKDLSLACWVVVLACLKEQEQD
ncbi:hypothetical protein O181_046009 [Austropuccinia psidii MF-1]|uniref:Uncharacterized protein n=1 Tax=Austropuccinia psidii MF-1 TaxID=1389203 RepID=A0A9Q3DN96_9BASI|nr:hypothetical protein [Austropuccinia psidii MF-1]